VLDIAGEEDEDVGVTVDSEARGRGDGVLDGARSGFIEGTKAEVAVSATRGVGSARTSDLDHSARLNVITARQKQNALPNKTSTASGPRAFTRVRLTVLHPRSPVFDEC
jgi:hypothetical protein